MANKPKNPFCPRDMVPFLVNSVTKKLKLKKKGMTLIKKTGPGFHPASYTTDTASFYRGKAAGGAALTDQPHVAPRLKKE